MEINTNKLLFDEAPLSIQPQLAVILGINEAIVLQQLHYWQRQSKNFEDERFWVFNTYEEWQKQFPFWSVRTIKTTFQSLISDGIILVGNFNRKKFDKTNWYSIDYEAFNCVCQKRKSMNENVHSIVQELHEDSAEVAPSHSAEVALPIPLDYHKTTNIKESKKDTDKSSFNEIINSYTDNEKLKDELIEFIKMRKLIKKPMTNRALQILLNKLDGLAKDNTVKKLVLEQSIVNCWQDIYEYKENKQLQEKISLAKSLGFGD